VHNDNEKFITTLMIIINELSFYVLIFKIRRSLPVP